MLYQLWFTTPTSNVSLFYCVKCKKGEPTLNPIALGMLVATLEQVKMSVASHRHIARVKIRNHPHDSLEKVLCTWTVYEEFCSRVSAQLG